MLRCRLDRFPDSWREQLRKSVRHADTRVQREAVAAIQTRGMTDYDKELAETARDANLSAELRIAAAPASRQYIRQIERKLAA